MTAIEREPALLSRIKMLDFHIEEVFPIGESYPLIINFQNGNPTENFKQQDCVYLENKTSMRKSVATEINNILYHGEECDEPLGKTLLLVRNRKTGKIKLIESKNVDVKPVMETKENTTELETSYVDLGRKFGSKRHKKQLEQYEKLKVSEEVVMEQLKDVSQNVSQDMLDLSSYNKTDAEEMYIPPINREANTVEDIYPLMSILSGDQYDTIFKELDSHDYKSDLCPLIKDIYSENWPKEHIVLAVYASSLLSCYHKLIKELKLKKFVACPHSETLNKIILNEFFTYKNNERMRPTQYRDKSVCYAIVFILLINNYKMDVEAFCKEMKLVDRTVVLKVNMTGAWIVRQGKANKKFAVLKLPLNKAGTNMKRRTR